MADKTALPKPAAAFKAFLDIRFPKKGRFVSARTAGRDTGITGVPPVQKTAIK